MTPQHHLPADIERTSLSIITAELDAMGLTPPPETAAVVKRVIHTTADFDYARNLRFTPGAVAAGVAALQAAAPIVTDTNMALSGITKPTGTPMTSAGRSPAVSIKSAMVNSAVGALPTARMAPGCSAAALCMEATARVVPLAFASAATSGSAM